MEEALTQHINWCMLRMSHLMITLPYKIWWGTVYDLVIGWLYVLKDSCSVVTYVLWKLVW